ncbi:uncharacterized protein BDV17DRAFT_188387 [Aspergillus undulatus]|uniref:uncharacterized protein n=1 Tax=Aspergillus undulatus TaxID=1810928 RepID=UPI003CCD1058
MAHSDFMTERSERRTSGWLPQRAMSDSRYLVISPAAIRSPGPAAASLLLYHYRMWGSLPFLLFLLAAEDWSPFYFYKSCAVGGSYSSHSPLHLLQSLQVERSSLLQV